MNYKRIKHGMWGTRFYEIWHSVKGRCTIETNSGWKMCGGKGIRISKEWEHFVNFKSDMYESYLIHSKEYGELNTRLIRINKKLLIGGFSKENCEWKTEVEQINSRHKKNGEKFNEIKLINYKGKIITIKELAKILDMSIGGIHYRIKNKLDVLSGRIRRKKNVGIVIRIFNKIKQLIKIK